jgi:hypothetical protein
MSARYSEATPFGAGAAVATLAGSPGNILHTIAGSAQSTPEQTHPLRTIDIIIPDLLDHVGNSGTAWAVTMGVVAAGAVADALTKGRYRKTIIIGAGVTGPAAATGLIYAHETGAIAETEHHRDSQAFDRMDVAVGVLEALLTATAFTITALGIHARRRRDAALARVSTEA